MTDEDRDLARMLVVVAACSGSQEYHDEAIRLVEAEERGERTKLRARFADPVWRRVLMGLYQRRMDAVGRAGRTA